jgi:hypothetical protein
MGGHRRSAAAGLAFLLLLLLCLWLFLPLPAPAPEPPPAPPAPAAPAPAEDAPPPDAPAPVPEEEAFTATVRVLDAERGEALGESLLDVETVGGPPGGPAESREVAGGRWTVRGPRGTVLRVVASCNGFVPAERWVLLGIRKEVPVHLAAAGTCAIRVHAASDGSPIPGARVVVTGEPPLHRGPGAPAAWTGRTDALGIANCPEAGPGRRIRVTVLGTWGLPTTLVADPAPEGLAVTLGAAFVSRLRVVDDRRSPIPGVRGLPVGFDGVPLLPEDLAPESDRDGALEVAAPAVLLSGTGRASRLVETGEDHRVRETKLEFAKSGGVTVEDGDGLPVHGCPVRLLPLAGPGPGKEVPGIPLLLAMKGQDGVTDARGRVEIPAVPQELSWFVAVGGAGGHSLATGFRASEELHGFPSFRVPAAARRTAEVLTPLGRPFGGAEVLLVPPGAFDDPPGGTDAWLRGAPTVRTGPDGTAPLFAPADGGLEAAVAAGPSILSGPRPLEAGDPVRFRLTAPILLRVLARGTGSAPVPGAVVRIRAAAGPGSPPSAILARSAQEAVTGPDGAAVLEVPPGIPFSLTATAAGALESREVPVAPVEAEATVEVPLLATRTAWVAITDREWRRIPGAAVTVTFEGLPGAWPVRGVTSAQGVLQVRVPEAEGQDAGSVRAVLSVLGPAAGWARVPLDSLVTGAQIRVELPPVNFHLLLLKEDRLLPRGTPFRWTAGLPGEGEDSGEGRVGEPTPVFLTRSRLEDLRVHLPGAVPMSPYGDERGAFDANRRQAWEFVTARRAEAEARRAEREDPPNADEHRRRIEALHQALRSGAFQGVRLPLRSVDLVNETGAWASARVTGGKGGGSVATPPLARGARARVFVPARTEVRVTWEPCGTGEGGRPRGIR